MTNATKGLQVYLVGGAVRDSLLGLTVHERDWVVVGSTSEEMISRGYQQVGRDFPVFLHPKSHEEYALARTERKTGPGYTGFEVQASPAVTLEDDLLRRDLTINAIAQRPDGTLVDPFGGIDDLNAKRLRHVSDAFTEDPVRVLRIARFAARFHHLGFRIAPETQVLMKNMVRNGEVSSLVPERVWQELHKSLLTQSPWIFIQVLHDCSALGVIFPELERLFGMPQNPEYHPEIDTGVHTLMVVEQARRLSNDPLVRFAALVHDLGKGTTPKSVLPRHSGHEERGIELVEKLCKRIKAPKSYRELGKLTAQFHTHIHRAAELRPSTVVKVLEQTDSFRRPERFEQLLLACEADSKGRTGFTERPYPQAELFRSWAQACRSIDIRPLTHQFKGEALKAEIHKERVRAAKALKA